MNPIPPELFTAFNDVTFYDEPHKYFIDGKELISVTTLIHRYQEEFDENSGQKLKELNILLVQLKLLEHGNSLIKKVLSGVQQFMIMLKISF